MKILRPIWFRNFFTILVVLLASSQSIAQDDVSEIDVDELKSVVTVAFEATHDGWSSDEVVLQDELNASFIAACIEELPDASPATLNWTLLNLRKAGKLKVKSTKRAPISNSKVELLTHLAEIVARTMQDKHQVSSDRLMCDPEMRNEFNNLATTISPDADLYTVRKAAFRLRKTRRLRPELITRIANWGRTIKEYPAEKLRENPQLLNEHPGIYIFRDASGYLYIGQTENLRDRMVTHLDESHNESLANYLKDNDCHNITIEIHDFDPDSQASKTMVRRAYESELISSRKPRFNIQP